MKDSHLRLILAAVGALLLLLGGVAALYGPAETYCFYLFSEGGRFHQEGFRFGSLMFALIAWQPVGYYVIALLCIPLGLGHLQPRRWARVMTIGLLWSGWVVGIPLAIVFLAFLSFKELSSTASLLVVAALGLSCLAAPGLLLRFYRSERVRRVFESRDADVHWIESLPMPILVLTILFTFFVIVLHVPLFFNGIFPVFGAWLSGIQGILALDLSIVSLACLTWGVFKRKAWAWWGSVGYLGLLTFSLLVTLVRSSLYEMLVLTGLPPQEVKILRGIPLQGIHLAPFIGIPLAVTLVVLALSKRHFGAPRAQNLP